MQLTLNRRLLALLLILALIALLLTVAAFHALHPVMAQHVHTLADSPDIIVHNH
jgi:hypothetical protein